MFENRFDVLLASLRTRKEGFLQQALAREFTNLFLSIFWIFFIIWASVFSIFTHLNIVRTERGEGSSPDRKSNK